ncbi:hypothetical protein CRUP_034789 [Coryphaenoides rupestris]|nr:hypothetical protein CRUP_034789 [Coryphaenoides rupestris]
MEFVGTGFETQRNGLVFIYDMAGSNYTNFELDLSKKILNLLKGAFPARLKKVLIVGAPVWFRVPYNLLSLLLKEKLRERAMTTGVATLRLFPPSANSVEFPVDGKNLPLRKASRYSLKTVVVMVVAAAAAVSSV